SEIIARSFEGRFSSLPESGGKEVVNEFRELDDKLRLMEMFGALNIPNIFIRGHENAIFVLEGDDLKIYDYSNTHAAWRALLDLEKEDQNKDIVFVCGDTTDAVRLAFTNYFSDAREFVKLINQGCEILSK
ncbi:MAG: (p)ppGpp synthetase, partial [Alphaproteobacteria bacterium]|nr:(p)ppGpp synthetase [Alphaproteobacteria bacterium]